MSIIDTLVTDRAQADVERYKALRSKKWENMTVEEQAEWFAGMKGAYNPTIDLNRVQSAVEYLRSSLERYGYSSSVAPLPTWTDGDVPTPQQLVDYLANVRNIRDVLQVASPLPDTMYPINYEGANQIEKALVDVEQTIERVVKSMSRSNAFTFWSGNRPIPSAESNLGRTWEELDAMNTTWRNWQVADWFLLLYGNLKAEGDVM